MKKLNDSTLVKNWVPALAFFLFGLLLRLSFVSGSDFPLHDGGLFTRMTEEVVANNFKLPYFTSFNYSNIPFVYPPLGFYLAAVIVKFTGVSALTLMQYLPAVLSSLTIPAFYFLAKQFLKSERSVYFASAAYILVPRSWTWLVMGGGLTRSLGVFFAILAVTFAHQLILNQQKRSLALTIFFTSLTILSHPETAVFVVASVILLYLVFSRSLAGFYSLLSTGLGTLVLASVWWLPAVLRHGPGPLMAAVGTNGFGIKFIRDLLLFGITEEIDSHLIATLAVIGLFFLLSKKQIFPPLWLLAALILTPRSSANYAMIPVSLMAGAALSEIVLPALSKDRVDTKMAGKPFFALYSPAALGLIVYIFVSALLSANLQLYMSGTVLTTLSEENRAAMAWVSKNTPEDSAFLILTEEYFWEDEVNEWFPYLADRQSLTTLQGSEWLPDEQFTIRNTWYVVTKTCLNDDPGCLEAQAEKYEIPFTHVYLPKLEDTGYPALAVNALRRNSAFNQVFDNSGAAIFEYRP